MHVTFFHSHYFDFKPAPPNVEVTEADVRAGRAIRVADDRYHLRVHLPAPDKETHTPRGEAEDKIANMWIFARLFPDGSWHDEWAPLIAAFGGMSRGLIACVHASKQMRGHSKPQHLTRIEVADADPSADHFDLAAKHYVDDKLVDPTQLAALKAEYLADKPDMQAFFNKFFGIKPAPEAK